MSCFYLCLFIFVLYVYLHLVYESQSLKLKKFWKKAIPDLEIWINLENSNNSIRKTKSESGVILEKNRACKERHKVGKIKLIFYLFQLTIV